MYFRRGKLRLVAVIAVATMTNSVPGMQRDYQDEGKAAES